MASYSAAEAMSGKIREQFESPCQWRASRDISMEKRD
jgi:hypothetical protein